jgi:hypothetical protein
LNFAPQSGFAWDPKGMAIPFFAQASGSLARMSSNDFFDCPYREKTGAFLATRIASDEGAALG